MVEIDCPVLLLWQWLHFAVAVTLAVLVGSCCCQKKLLRMYDTVLLLLVRMT